MKLGELFNVLGGLSHRQVKVYKSDMTDEIHIYPEGR